MTGSIESWSTTASDNDDADGDINWTEGQNAKTVNNSARQMMGRVKEWLNDMGGLGTVGGTANAITLTLNSSYTSLVSGLKCALKPTSDNTGAVTLNVNGIGAKAIRKFDSSGEVALAAGDLQSGGFYFLIYDSTADTASGAWICINPTSQPQSAKLIAIAALTPTDGNIIVGNGTTWVAESGATARTSLGLGTAATSASTAFATAAQGTLATNAMPKSGGTFSGAITAPGVAASLGTFQGSSTVAVLAPTDAGGAVYARPDGPNSTTGQMVVTTSGMTLGGNAVLTADADLGWGQTWQNVKASRAINTAYQNTTSAPIQVSVRTANGGDKLQASSDASTWVDVAIGDVGVDFLSGMVIVPPNHYYKISGTGTVNLWAELR